MNDVHAPTGALADRADVELIYQLFLGRPPEDAACVEANLGCPVVELARSFIGSAEFAARMAGIECGTVAADPQGAPDDMLSAGLGLLSRITGTVPDDPPPHSMRAILGLALGSGALWPDFLRHFGGRAIPLLAAVAADAPATAGADWLGHIDFAADWLIRGWVYRKTDPRPARLGLLIDGRLIAHVEASQFRPDVAEAIGITGNCGFELRPHIPDTLRREGAVLSLVDLSSGAALPFRRPMLFSAPPAPPKSLDAELQDLIRSVAELTDRLAGFGVPGPVPVGDYHLFRSNYRLPPVPPRISAGGQDDAVFSLVLPLLPGDADGLAETVASLCAQDRPGWELLVVTGRDRNSAVPDGLRDAAAQDQRIRLMEVVGLRNAVEARAVGIRAAMGSHVIPLVPGVGLEPGALAWLAHAARLTGARAIYTDHCQAAPLGAGEYLYSAPALKPAFDHDLLLQHDYVGPVFCLETALARAATVKEDRFAADLFFRATQRLQFQGIAHLPLPVFRLPVENAAEPGADGYRDASVAHLSRIGLTPGTTTGTSSPLGQADDWLGWPSPATGRRLSIIIATHDRRDLLEPCIDSIRRHLADPAQCEIVVVDNDSRDPMTRAYLDELSRDPAIRVLPFEEEFNWSRANNIAAASCTGDLLLFLNNDIELLTPGFDEVIRQQLARPDAGVLGCLLLYPDGPIQHAGTVIGVSGIAAHIGVGLSPATDGLPDWHRLTRRVSAVTGAFMAVPAGLFADLGGFDEAALKITLNDVDFCLRVGDRGKTVLYTPVITCLHHESASRGDDGRDQAKLRRAAVERAAFSGKWPGRLRFDLFHSPGFSLNRPPFTHVVMPTAEGITAYLAYQMQRT